MIDERDGALSLPISAGPLTLRWDSRIGVDRYGLGAGWGFGLASIVVDGGVRVTPAAGGSFEVDTTQPTGLVGYTLGDVRFSSAGGVLAGGDHGASVPFAYALTELGGTSTYFNEAGDPVARVTADGARVEYTWDASVPHRLVAVTDADGLVTGLDWSAEAALRILPGANVSAPADGSSAGGAWVVHRGSRGEVLGIESPIGSQRSFVYDGDLVSRTEGASGAVTEIDWHTLSDQRARVHRVRVLDRSTGAELSFRSWRAVGGTGAAAGAPVASGWPRVADPSQVVGEAYETEVTDGQTRVRTQYTALHQLTARRVFGAGVSGEQLLQEQRFTYAEDGEHSTRTADRFLPTRTEVVHHDATGASRAVAESVEYDDFGRAIERTDRTLEPGSDVAETTTTRYTYDARDRLTSSTTVSSNATSGGTGDGASERRTAYTLTPTDNVASSTVTETSADADRAASTTTEFSYGPVGELLTVTADGVPSTQVFDAAGNLVRAADGTTYTYDAANRPVSESDDAGDTVTTRYWSDGSRAMLAADTGTTRYYWNGADLVNDAHETGGAEATASYLLGLTRHARTTPAGTSYYGHDRHGNVTQLTDAHGEVTAAHTYTDYGAPLDTAAEDNTRVGHVDYQPFGHAGSYVNPTRTRTHHLEARTYDPARMHFTSLDPAPLRNRFAFGNLNPITNIDPTGHDAMSDAGLGLSIAGLILTVAGSVATLAFTGGGALAVFGAVAATGFDLTVASLEVVQASGTRIMSDAAALALGVAAFGVGLAAAAIGAAASRTAKRGWSRLADDSEDFDLQIQGLKYERPYSPLDDIQARGTAPVSREVEAVLDEVEQFDDVFPEAPPRPTTSPEPPARWSTFPGGTATLEFGAVLHYRTGLPRDLVNRVVWEACAADPTRRQAWAGLLDHGHFSNLGPRQRIAEYIHSRKYRIPPTRAWHERERAAIETFVAKVRDVVRWASLGNPDAQHVIDNFRFSPAELFGPGTSRLNPAAHLTMEQIAWTRYDFD